MEHDIQLNSMSDEELVELAHGGTGAAKEILYDRYKSMVRAKTRAYFLMGADNEDLLQEGMIGLFKAVRDYDPALGVPFKSFARLCISRHVITAISYAASDKQRPMNSYISLFSPLAAQDDVADQSLLIDVLPDDSIDVPEALIMRDDIFESLYAKAETVLTSFELSVLQLFLDGLSYKDIATQLNRNIKAVDNALQRIRAKLSELHPD